MFPQVPEDLRKAMVNLGVPNANEARAVDARQEIDLKVLAPALTLSSIAKIYWFSGRM
jgi:hypothetical protein